MIMHGIEEMEEETPDQLKTKVKEVLSHTVNLPTQEERSNTARNIPIVSMERIGRYNEQRNRPISVIFENKLDSELLLNRKKDYQKECLLIKNIVRKRKRKGNFLDLY